ncbi:MAG: Omp28 family outer membrane lipoprotein [Muribaculaceae bacterium]|nr:Omp28 family outer membrane lipoprotein [Muribaculaceae bacterium]
MISKYLNLPLFGKGIVASACICLLAGLASCDNVDEADRFIKVERPEIARKVLVQEFTGQGCINCPQGAALVHSMQSQYPGAIVAVNLHPENTQYTRPLGGLKLTSKEATAYYQYYKPAMLPSAVIDGAAPVSNVSLWTDAILQAIARPAPADLELTTEYNSATRELKVTYSSTFNEVFSSPLNINVWLMENDIVGPQYSGSNILRDYVHNHVLRTSLTGEWGVAVADSFIPNDKFTATFSIVIDESWKAENCEVIAFLQNPSSKAVEQSAEAPVINHE